MTDLENRITNLVSPSLGANGYMVVRVKLRKARSETLQLMIERVDGQPITVEDCAKASRIVSKLLDVEDPIQGEYNLEVSSPGIDRPLVKLEDFDRFKGFEAKITASEDIEGRKRFRGTLEGVEGTHVLIATTEGTASIEYGNIASAKLVLNDTLLAAAQDN